MSNILDIGDMFAFDDTVDSSTVSQESYDDSQIRDIPLLYSDLPIISIERLDCLSIYIKQLKEDKRIDKQLAKDIISKVTIRYNSENYFTSYRSKTYYQETLEDLQEEELKEVSLIKKDISSFIRESIFKNTSKEAIKKNFSILLQQEKDIYEKIMTFITDIDHREEDYSDVDVYTFIFSIVDKAINAVLDDKDYSFLKEPYFTILKKAVEGEDIVVIYKEKVYDSVLSLFTKVIDILDEYNKQIDKVDDRDTTLIKNTLEFIQYLGEVLQNLEKLLVNRKHLAILLANSYKQK